MYDLVILGSGPAGYVAAERAGAMGKTVALVEKDRLGGVCLNRGCIPTKSFLGAAKLYDHALHGTSFGVSVSGAAFDYGLMRSRTQAVQDKLVAGVTGLMKRAGVTVVRGQGSILDRNTVLVGDERYTGRNLLICTGSRPAVPPIPGLPDNPRVVDSTGILALDRPAEHLVVIGGGVIGIEFACFYALIGKRVTVVEMLPQVCGAVEPEVAAAVKRKLEAKGAAVHCGSRVDRIDGGTVHFTDREGLSRSVDGDSILCAAGRTANLEGYGLENLVLDRDKSRILVNERAETSLPGVYAAGDVTGRWQLAHFASRQATVAVNTMFGVRDICREDAIPAVVYADPEVASVGLTEAGAEVMGLPVRSITVPLAASGRFLAETEGERGFMKAVLGERDQLLGMHIVAPYASEMIGAACVMIENELRAQDIRELVFPHPTVSELMKELMFN